MNELETKNHIATAVGLTVVIGLVGGIAAECGGTQTTPNSPNLGLPSAGEIYKGYEPVEISSDPEILKQLEQIFSGYEGASCIPINNQAGVPAVYTAALIAGNPKIIENPVALVTKSGEVQSGSIYQVGTPIAKGEKVVYNGEQVCVGVNQ
jgi:hypothetical protein